MNFGAYFSNLKSEKTSVDSFAVGINNCIEDGTIDDASIFFDLSGSSLPELKCGTFNSTDLCHFKGSLFFVQTSLIKKIASTVNDIKVYLGYGYGDKDVLNILYLISACKDVKVICRTKEDSDYFYRISGQKSIGLGQTPEEIIHLMKETSHE
tara:strand:- start:1371 stop:1829 length:459 start_codon:yes stop_codon:yes gene_type:complete